MSPAWQRATRSAAIPSGLFTVSWLDGKEGVGRCFTEAQTNLEVPGVPKSRGSRSSRVLEVLGARVPSDAVELPHPASGYSDALSCEQRTLEALASAVLPDAPAGRDDPVAGNVRAVAASHDVSHGSSGARCARHYGDVSVRRHAAGRDATHGRQNARREIRPPFQLSSTC